MMKDCVSIFGVEVQGGGPQCGRRSGGFVLVAVMVIVMLLSMLVVSLMFRFHAEDTASGASVTTEQAWSTALSGVEEALRVAATVTPGSTDWQNNPGLFRERFVFDDGSDRWFFTIFSPGGPEDLSPVVFGFSDEASRVNLNTAPVEALSRLPGVTPTLGLALHNFIDASAPATSGTGDLASGLAADLSFSMESTNAVRRGPLASIEELRLVPGFPVVLLDPPAVDSTNRADGLGEGRPVRGLRDWLCTDSYEPNVNSERKPRVNLNSAGAAWPATLDLPPEFTNYVAALRAAKVRIGHPSELLEASRKVRNEAGEEAEVQSGITKQEIGKVLDLFTASSKTRLDGAININTASAEVLATLPGVDETLAESIVSTRRGLSAERRASVAWLVQESLVDADKFKLIAPNITTRSFQFRFQVLAYGVPAGRFRLLEVVIDAAGSRPQVTYLRDITKRGMPFPVNQEPASTDSAASGIGRKEGLRG